MKTKLLKILKSPHIIILYLMNHGFFNWLPDSLYLRFRYRLVIKEKLDLKKPKTFNEKLQWLKLNDRNPKYIDLVDKYKVREFIKSTIGEEYLIQLLGVYDNFEDIKFDELPNKFVIKCNHDSGGLVICRDKQTFNKEEARKKINKSLKRNYYFIGREWPYKNIERKIIIEKYMSNEDGTPINDYKFIMSNGKLAYSFIASDRFEELKFTFFDKKGNLIDVACDGCGYDKNIKQPKNYSKMIKLAEKLSKGIPQVRVDFYEINNRIYFGELTFFDSSGFNEFDPKEWDLKFGDMLDLSEVIKNGQ